MRLPTRTRALFYTALALVLVGALCGAAAILSYIAQGGHDVAATSAFGVRPGLMMSISIACFVLAAGAFAGGLAGRLPSR